MRSILAASTIALLYAASTLAAPWIGKVPPPYQPLQKSRLSARFDLSNNVYRTDLVKFQSFSGANPFQSWLQQTLDYKYVKPLFEKVQAAIKKPLKNRGEAHITVITPPEFDLVLKPVGITMDDINKIASRLWIQKAEFTAKCIGRARINLNYQTDKDEAYFVVVESQDLLKIREEIEKLYVSKGGEASLFDARAFWPHVTLGFTARDMFSNDGVWKGLNACWAGLNVYHDRPPSRPRGGKSHDDESAQDSPNESAEEETPANDDDESNEESNNNNNSKSNESNNNHKSTVEDDSVKQR